MEELLAVNLNGLLPSLIASEIYRNLSQMFKKAISTFNNTAKITGLQILESVVACLI